MEPIYPCTPSPCGPNSQCKELNNQAVCSCLPTFIGSPPMCRPECTTSAECPTNLACVNKKCKDPCPGVCGHSAYCRVINHSPMCICNLGFTGDPFSICNPIQSNYYLLLTFLERFYYILYTFRCSRTVTSATNKSVYTITMWSLFSMPRLWRFSFMYMPSVLYRIAAKL